MTRARWRVAAIAGIVAAALAIAVSRREPAELQLRPPGARPTLLLLTSLPLVLPEQFTIKGGGSPPLRAIETRYRVVKK